MTKLLPPVKSKVGLHISAVLPGSILLADHLQAFILIFLKLIMEISKNGRLIIPFKKFSRFRVELNSTDIY